MDAGKVGCFISKFKSFFLIILANKIAVKYRTQSRVSPAARHWQRRFFCLARCFETHFALRPVGRAIVENITSLCFEAYFALLPPFTILYYTMRRPFALPLVFLLLLAASATLGREFWLEIPHNFRLPASGGTRRLRLLTGQNFEGEQWPGKARRVRCLARYGPAPADSTGLTPRQPGPTDTLAASIDFRAPGTHLVALQTTAAFLRLPAEKFTAYLTEEGLTNALALRRVRHQDTAAGREAYRRCAKTLVQVGPAPANAAPADTAYRRVLGWALELVAEQNPYRLRPGAALTVRVLRAGQPAASAQVQVWERQAGGQPTRHAVLHANQNGRLLLRVSGPGPYLLAAVDMVPMPRPAPAGMPPADWLSTWASLTFAGPASLKARP